MEKAGSGGLFSWVDPLPNLSKVKGWHYEAVRLAGHSKGVGAGAITLVEAAALVTGSATGGMEVANGAPNVVVGK